MFDFNFTFTPISMDIMYKTYEDEYQWGWISVADLNNYVASGIIPASEFEKITGQKYLANRSNA